MRVFGHHDRAGAAESFFRNAEWAIVAAGLVVIPLWVSGSGRDSYRIPKLLLLRGEGIVLVALLAAGALSRTWSFPKLRLSQRLIPLAIVAWTAIAVLLSDHAVAAVPSLITVIAAVLIFLGAVKAAARPASIWIIFPAPVVVATIAVIQLNDRWNRATLDALIGGADPEMLPRVSPVSLLGNRNDVGTYLVAPTVCALVLAHLLPRRRGRIISAVLALVLTAGILASNTATAILALGASLLTIALLSWRRRAVVLLIVAAIVVGSSALLLPSLQKRIVTARRSIATRNWDALLTFRLVAFMAANEMIARHPIRGIGPGMFGREYFQYKIVAAEKHPALLHGAGSSDLFEETHDDHLEVAAETGVIGYALFVVAIVALARISWTTRDGGLARNLALPVAVSLFVLTLAQSPLQRAVTIASYSYLAGACVGWSRND